MLKSFDLFSLQMSSTLASFAFFLVFAVMWRGRRADEYFLHWSLSSLIYAVTLIGFQLSRPTSLLPGCILYGLLSVTNVLGISGLRHILGLKPFAAWMLGLVALTMAFYGFPGAARMAFPDMSKAIVPIGHAIGLLLSMTVVGTVWLRTCWKAECRGGIITGLATLGYIPGYCIAIAGELGWSSGNDWLALIPMISDQLLLGVLNLGLLAIPVERAQARLRDAALRDPLTGCWNRAGFAQRSAALPAEGGAILAIDVDHFKQLNDQFGHAAGDQALIRLGMQATAMAELFGGDAARLGGDEFVILLPGRSAGEAQLFGDQLRSLLAMSSGEIAWTISLGISTTNADEWDYSEAIKRADRALYRAKSEGRDRVAA
jgi:diguanylate cyclase (GGDEF)-like protein